MNKPMKDWGAGIPKYTEEDILQGLELQEWCTNIVAETMQNEGYTIEGIIVNSLPTQVIANKDGKRYDVMVAGAGYPDLGKISFAMKQRFADFCQSHGFVPMFAPVSLMPMDPERRDHSLLLKYDGYYIKYTGNENLIGLQPPSSGDDEYSAYIVEKIIAAYENADFESLFGFFDKDIEFHSQWVLQGNIGYDAVTNYFVGKGKTLRKSPTEINGGVVAITDGLKMNGNVGLWSESGKKCALISQHINGQTNWIIISVDFNKEGKITKMCLNDPALFNFEYYYVC